MQRYFFDTDDGSGRISDTEGQVLPSFEAARKLAVEEVAQMIRDEMPDGRQEAYVVIVRDENRWPIYVATALMRGEPLG